MFGDKYIVEIGRATDPLISAVLAVLLTTKYQQDYDSKHGSDFCARLAAAVTNMVLCHESSDQKATDFLRENQPLVLDNARKINQDSQLCFLISGAAYNISYSNFVLMGGKRGFLNRFVGFVRALSRSYFAEPTQAMEAYEFWRSCLDALGPQRDAVKPLLTLHNLGLFVPLGDNPDERAYYDTVARRAKDLRIIQ